jgi:hypothetical protein
MAARMMKLETVIDPPFPTYSAPAPPAAFPDPLYAMLLAHGSRLVALGTLENAAGAAIGSSTGKRPASRPPQPAPPREAAPDRHVTSYDPTLDLWIRALRSGRYRQLRGAWHYRDELCAVEVLLHELGYEDSAPREPWILKIGLDLCSFVVALNDWQGWSFERIADWLATKPVISRKT